MGKIKSDEDIKSPQLDELETSQPPTSQPEQGEEAETPKPSQTAVSLLQNSQPGKVEEHEVGKPARIVVSFPPDIEPGHVEEAQTPVPSYIVAPFPPNSKPGQIVEVETPKPGYINVPFSPKSKPEEGEEVETPKSEERVVSFPPKSQPRQKDEIEMVETAEPIASLPQNPTVPHHVGNPWSTGLFECSQDTTNAVMTAFFPCSTFGQIAEILDAGKITCPYGSLIYLLMMPPLCSSWIMGSKYRKKLRMKYGLVEAPYKDVFSHIFCPLCSLCQEFRELKNRGLDPAVGWNGILAQQQHHQQTMVHNNPPPIQAMSK